MDCGYCLESRITYMRAAFIIFIDYNFIYISGNEDLRCDSKTTDNVEVSVHY